MKTKTISIIILLLVILCPTALRQTNPISHADEVYYAKVETSGVQLCSTPSVTSALFEIPSSYFVQVEYIVDEFYKVTYKNVSGYVLRENVTLMSGTPTTPFAEATFSLFVAYSLFSSASESSALASLPSGTTLTYYGTKSGTAVKSDNTTWFYCSAETDSGTLFGYIYSGVTDHMTSVPENLETFSILSDDIFSDSSTELSSLSVGTKIMLIVAIAVPSLFILYFLIKPNRIMSASRKRPKKMQTRAKGKADYFEFNENEL